MLMEVNEDAQIKVQAFDLFVYFPWSSESFPEP